MRQISMILLLTAISACSSRTDTEEAHKMARWNGRPESEIMDHSYFKNLPKKISNHEDGSKTIIFTDQTKFQTGAYCQSLGGCIGMPAYNCQHLVKIKDQIISGIEQQGTCPGTSTTTP